MLQVEADLIGVSPLSFSKQITEKRKPKEAWEAYEARTWREKLHYDEKGEVYIPAQAIKLALENAGSYMAENPGKERSSKSYGPIFKRGLLIVEPLMLGIKKDKVESIIIPVPSDGKRGGGRQIKTLLDDIKKKTGRNSSSTKCGRSPGAVRGGASGGNTCIRR